MGSYLPLPSRTFRSSPTVGRDDRAAVLVLIAVVDPIVPVDLIVPVDRNAVVDPTLPVDRTAAVDPNAVVDPIVPVDRSVAVALTVPADRCAAVDRNAVVDPIVPVDRSVAVALTVRADRSEVSDSQFLIPVPIAALTVQFARVDHESVCRHRLARPVEQSEPEDYRVFPADERLADRPQSILKGVSKAVARATLLPHCAA